MSDSAIHQAIVAVMREIGAIGKDSENAQQKYHYRSIEQVYDRVQPLFAKHGIFSFPKVIEQRRETGKSRQGGDLHFAILTIEYTFAAEDGSSICVTVVGEGMDSGDKASNKAMSAGHKYAICQVLNIPYNVIDPDAFTPDWVGKLDGKVTLAQLNQLKKAWDAKHAEVLTGTSREDKPRLFAEWVRQTLGPNFDLGGKLDVGDFRQWSVEDYEQCMEAAK